MQIRCFFFCALLMASICLPHCASETEELSAVEESGSPEEEAETNPSVPAGFVPVSTEHTLRLDSSTNPQAEGAVGPVLALGNMAMRWNGIGSLTWDVFVQTPGPYKASVSMASLQPGATVVVSSEG